MWIVYEKHGDVPFSFPSSSKTSLKQSQFIARITVEDHRQKDVFNSRWKLQIAKREVLHYHIIIFESNTSSD